MKKYRSFDESMKILENLFAEKTLKKCNFINNFRFHIETKIFKKKEEFPIGSEQHFHKYLPKKPLYLLTPSVYLLISDLIIHVTLDFLQHKGTLNRQFELTF